MIWTPPTDVSRQYRQEALAALVLSDELKHFNRELRDIDPKLQIAWVDERTHIAGLRPGRFHLLRDNDPFPPTLVPLEDEDGGFLPLGSHVFDMVHKLDLWNDRAQRERVRLREAALRAKDRERVRETAERRQEFLDRLKALEPGVSMTGQGKGWSYRAGAKKAA